MFDFVKNHKLVSYAILALIVVPFAFFGLESYTRSMRGADDVASVDGTPITQREFAEELRRQQDRLRQALGRGADLSAFDTPEMRQALLDSMIAERVVGRSAVRANLLVADETLRDLISSTPAFQAGGRFSMASYEAQLRAQGMTPAGYEARLRYEIATTQLSRAVAETAIPGRSAARRVVALEEEKREIAEAKIGAEAFLGQVKIDEARLRAHYDANTAAYRTPEQVRAEVAVLSAADLSRGEPATEAEIKAAYDARAAQYRVEEQRRASHILIQAGAEAKDAERAAARKKAEGILAELKKAPRRFAELAKKHSQDPGSAEKGGDLGFFGRGMMVKAFEDAAFAMKDGETSGVVESEFGYHIIRITGVQGARGKPLAEVRNELAAEIQRQKGMRRFSEAAEAFGNMVYEQSESLNPVAQRFGLQVRTTGWITKAGSPELGPLNHRRLLDALFSSDSIAGKRNTDAIEVAPNTLAAARIAEHRPAAQRSYDEVKAEIERTLRRREAARLAQQDGAARLARLQQGGDGGVKWSATREVSRRSPQGLDAETLRRVLLADTAKLPAHVGVERGDEGYVLYRVLRNVPAPAKNEQQEADDLARVERQAGLAQYEAFVANLRSQADITVNKTSLAAKP